jgi:hypothetical protein
MNEFRLAHVVVIVANLFLGIALMGGGAFLARRSLASASWAALAGFGVVAADVLRASATMMMVRYGVSAFYVHAPISLAEAVLSMGGLMMAVHSLPPRAAWTR